MKEKNYNQILLIGVSIFAWLTISGISYTFYIFLRDIMIILEVNPSINLIITNILYLLFFSLLILMLLHKAKKRDFYFKGLFTSLIILFIFIQIIQFFYTSFFTEYLIENFTINIENYYDGIKNLKIKYLLEPVIDATKYLIVIFCFFFQLRKVKTSD